MKTNHVEGYADWTSADLIFKSTMMTSHTFAQPTHWSVTYDASMNWTGYTSACFRERCSRGRAPDCQSRGRWCLSEETVKPDGPFYLVSMPGEVEDPTQRVNV